MSIPVYAAEKELGLEEKIKASASITYASEIVPTSDDEKKLALALLDDKTKGSHGDSDLYPTKSILATSNWNKNDDVFSVAEMWRAKDTPSHKPTNIEHDEKQLVGHIVDCWAVDLDGKVISSNTPLADLPNTFHLVNSAVIYLNWQDEVLQERTDTLIQQIEAGEKFVSMEALFSDFDYAIEKPDGKLHIVARDEDTAWMTQHLRSYGGTGQYEDYKIGRLLKNITFCGKGYVNKPANPDSIIFASDEVYRIIDFSNASTENPLNQEKESNGVNIIVEEQSFSKETDIMSENILKEQNAELKSEVDTLKTSLAEANDKLAKAGTEKYEQQITELQSEAEASQEKIEASTEKLTEANEQIETLTQEIKELKEANAELDEAMAKIEAEKVQADRTSTLVDGGVAKDIAEAKVELFKALDDEQFDAVAQEILAANKPTEEKTEEADASDETDDEDESDASEDTAEANAEEESLENAEEDNEADLSTAGETSEEDEDDDIETLASELVTMLKKNSNEGDK
jgi:hypothetical protein